MANVVEKQILSDGPRNVVVRFAGTLDTSDVSIAPALRMSDLSTDPFLVLAGLKVYEIEYSIGTGLTVQLYWNSANPQLLAALSESNEIHYYPSAAPDRTRPGYDGDINLSTSGFVLGKPSAFSFVLFMRKRYT